MQSSSCPIIKPLQKILSWSRRKRFRSTRQFCLSPLHIFQIIARELVPYRLEDNISLSSTTMLWKSALGRSYPSCVRSVEDAFCPIYLSNNTFPSLARYTILSSSPLTLWFIFLTHLLQKWRHFQLVTQTKCSDNILFILFESMDI